MRTPVTRTAGGAEVEVETMTRVPETVNTCAGPAGTVDWRVSVNWKVWDPEVTARVLYLTVNRASLTAADGAIVPLLGVKESTIPAGVRTTVSAASAWS